MPGVAYSGGVEPLIDPFGRRVTDLRVSITDRCNFRCTYCMPAEGMQWLPREELLTYEEQAQIVRVCVERYGFESVRITGGEPTLRAHLPRLVGDARAARHRHRDDHERREAARRWPTTSPRRACGASTSRSTRSAPTCSYALTRRDDLHRVLAGIDAALDAGLDPVKVNCVVMRGVNDDEVVDLAAYGRERGVGVRFIEFMPLDAARRLELRPGRARSRDPRTDQRGVPARRRCRARVGAHRARRTLRVRRRHRRRRRDRERHRAVLRQLRPDPDHRRGQAPDLPVRARRVRPADDRPRRRPPTATIDDRIAAEIARAVGTKWAGHRIGQVDFIRPSRSMSQIGG